MKIYATNVYVRQHKLHPLFLTVYTIHLALIDIHFKCSIFLSLLTVNTPNKLESLKAQVFTDMEGNPPIYITRKRTQQGDEMYVNNAMILKSRSNIELKNEQGKRQVCFHAVAKWCADSALLFNLFLFRARKSNSQELNRHLKNKIKWK